MLPATHLPGEFANYGSGGAIIGRETMSFAVVVVEVALAG
jgi:hypothetical protein